MLFEVKKLRPESEPLAVLCNGQKDCTYFPSNSVRFLGMQRHGRLEASIGRPTSARGEQRLPAGRKANEQTFQPQETRGRGRGSGRESAVAST